MPATTKVLDAPPLGELLTVETARADILAALSENDAVIVRNVLPHAEVLRIIDYLSGVGRGSFPRWRPITPNCPNFHRMNRWDERAYVRACFHQFSFFPWNDDLLDLFSRFRDIFRLRNLLSGVPQDAYLGPAPEDDCIARLSFQFYPRGGGAMNKHKDPTGVHQAVVPSLIMSKRGEDFRHGGAYVENAIGETIFLEEHANPGDLALFNPQMPHGVAPIDPDSELDWPAFAGRWMCIIAVNKLATNTRVADSVDIDAAR